jgi:hypothetical protein
MLKFLDRYWWLLAICLLMLVCLCGGVFQGSARDNAIKGTPIPKEQVNSYSSEDSNGVIDIPDYSDKPAEVYAKILKVTDIRSIAVFNVGGGYMYTEMVIQDVKSGKTTTVGTVDRTFMPGETTVLLCTYQSRENNKDTGMNPGPFNCIRTK